MGCGDSEGGCGDSGGCCKGPQMDRSTYMLHSLGELCDAAWAELVKEKLKAKLQSKQGKDLDTLVDFLYDASMLKWENPEEFQKKEKELAQKLSELL